MKAISMDLRERVLADGDAGMGTREVATKYRVSESWVRRLKQRRRETGEVEPRKPRSKRQPVLAAHREQLQKLVQERPDATLRELRELLNVQVGLATMWRALHDLKLTFKKKFCARLNRIAQMSSSGVPPGKPR